MLHSPSRLLVSPRLGAGVLVAEGQWFVPLELIERGGAEMGRSCAEPELCCLWGVGLEGGGTAQP